MKITLELLIKLDACKEQRELFSEVFGHSLELPIEEKEQHKLATTLTTHEFDRAWVFFKLLTKEQRSEYFEIGREMLPVASEFEWDIPRWVTVIKILTNTL